MSDRYRYPKRPTGVVAQWWGVLQRYATRNHLRVRRDLDDSLLRLAALLALVGPPGFPEGDQAFHALKRLFLTRLRIPRFHLALDEIPADRQRIWHLVQTIQIYERLTGQQISSGAAAVDRVTRIMLQIPNSEEYIARLAGSELNGLGAMFHPNTLKRAAGTQRGYAAGAKEYWDATAEDLDIVDD